MNNDNCVDMSDMSIFKDHFGNTEISDLNSDTVVDSSDLAFIMIWFDAACSSDVEAEIQELEGYFLENLNTPNSETGGRKPIEFWSDTATLSGNSQHYYGVDYALDGVIAMYDATGKTEYLDLALLWITNMISTASDFNNNGFLEWRRNGGGRHRQSDLKATMNWPKVVQSINRHPELQSQHPSDIGFVSGYADMTYREMGDAVLTFVDYNIVQKYLLYTGYGNDAIGWNGLLKPQDNDEPNNTIAGYWLGEQTLATRVALETYLAGETDKKGPIKENPTKTWKDFATEMLVQFKEERSTSPGDVYLWNIGEVDWEENQSNPGVPDTTHYNRTAHLMRRAFDEGLVFNEQDRQDIARTLTESIWNGVSSYDNYEGVNATGNAPDYNTMWFYNYIDGQDAPYGYTTCSNPNTYGDCYQRFNKSGSPHNGFYQGMSGWVYDGWCTLGKYDESVQNVCSTLMDFLVNGAYRANAIQDRNGSVWGRVALPANLAKNLREKTW